MFFKSTIKVVTAIQGLIDAADEQLKKRTVDEEDQVSKMQYKFIICRGSK